MKPLAFDVVLNSQSILGEVELEVPVIAADVTSGQIIGVVVVM